MSKDIIGKSLGMNPNEKPGITMLTKQVPRDDYEFARNNLYDIISQGGSALTDMLDVAQQSQSPRAYEVASTLIRTLVDANKDLLNIAVTNKDLTRKEEGPQTVNNNLFVGSSADLLKMLKDKKEEPSGE